MELLITVWLVAIPLTWVIATIKEGWFVGGMALLAAIVSGPLALLVVLVTGTKCAQCRKSVRPKATICPYCRTRRVVC